MRLTAGLVVGLVTLLVAGCDGGRSGSNVTPPGNPESGRTRVLEAGAAMLQDKAPLEALNAYLDGFHFYSGTR